MAIITDKISVGTTATKLVDVDNVTRFLRLHSKGSIYIGAGGVTSTTGFLSDNGDKLEIQMAEGEQLWAITSAATADIYIYISKID
jgi:hypothetical protein